MIVARWANVFGATEPPVPLIVRGRPSARTLAIPIAVCPAGTLAWTRAFQRNSIVNAGGRSSAQVRRVAGPVPESPAEAGAQPEGDMVHPTHGSSKPYPGAQASSSAGTVSQMWTLNHVFVADTFFTYSE